MSVEKEYDLFKAEMGKADFSFYDRLVTEKGGNEELNKSMSEIVNKYAMYGYKKGGLFGWGGHAADEKVSDEELREAAKAMNNNTTVYESVRDT